MAHLPPGCGEPGVSNYEVRGTYTTAAADRPGITAAATEAFGAEEGAALAWLRLYFEEVVWPAAESQLARVEALSKAEPHKVYRTDGCTPAGTAVWAAARLPEAAEFVRGRRGR